MLTSELHPQTASDLHLAQLLRDVDTDPSTLRYLGNMALLACYDREVERSYMIEVINANAQMTHALIKLSKCGVARHMLDRLGKTEYPNLDASVDAILVEIRRFREQLADKVTALAECPNEDDMIS